MRLLERQQIFARLFARLLLTATYKGYEYTIGDVWAKPRDPLEHTKNSMHYIKCAGDVNLFRDDKYLDKTSDHRELGSYWESLHPNCRWGGRYGDGNHYEFLDKPREKK